MRSLLLTLMLSICGSAQALVIDFEEVDFNVNSYGVNGEFIESRNFLFSDITSDPDGNVRVASHLGGLFPQVIDDKALYLLGNNEFNSGWDGVAALRMVNADYDPFSLNSFVSGTSTSLQIYGFFDDYDDQYLLATVYSEDLYSVDLGNGLTEYFLPESFAYINRVRFTDVREMSGPNGFYLDNVTVNSVFVPIPAAVWLFGSALAALGWLRRNRPL